MFLQYRFHSTQKEWENETCHKSEISKTLSPEKNHFKMDTLSKGLNLTKSKNWTIIVDLSDAYLQVSIFKKIQTISKILHLMENTLFRAHSCTQKFREITLDRL
jgi:hypothetical protein